MGTYIYRVTAQRVMCADGEEANVALYAYKPSWSDEKFNSKMDFRSGCPAARKLAREGKLTKRIVLGHVEDGRVTVNERPVYGNPHQWGTFSDDGNLGTSRMPVIFGREAA